MPDSFVEEVADSFQPETDSFTPEESQSSPSESKALMAEAFSGLSGGEFSYGGQQAEASRAGVTSAEEVEGVNRPLVTVSPNAVKFVSSLTPGSSALNLAVSLLPKDLQTKLKESGEGSAEATAEMISGMTSPASIAMTPAFLIPGVREAMMAYFARQATKQGAETMGEASVTGDTRQMSKGATQFGAGLGMALPIPGSARSTLLEFRPNRIVEGGTVPPPLPESEVSNALHGETETPVRDVQQPGGAQEGAGEMPVNVPVEETGARSGVNANPAQEGQALLLAENASKDLGLQFRVQEGFEDMPASWQFDYRPEGGKRGFTFYTEENATPQEIGARFKEKLKQFGYEHTEKETSSAPSEEPISVGPGAQTSGEPKYEAIRQLTDQLNAIPAVGAKEKLNLGKKAAETWAQGKSEVERATGLMRNVTEALKSTFRGVRTPKELDAKLGEFDYVTQRSSSESRKAGRAMERQMPNPVDREAAALLVDAGGDTAKIQDALSKLPEGTSAHLRAVVERAANPDSSLRNFASQLEQFFGIRENDAVTGELFEQGLQDYYTHIWEKPENMPESLRGALNSGKVGTYFRFARQRTIPTILEGILQGKKPILDPSKVVPFYNYAMDKALASRELIRQATELKASDGRPLVEPSGVGSVIEPGESEGAIVINPKAKPEQISDYVPIDHPALRKWKWVTKTEDGQNVFVRGDLVVHPEYYERLARIMDRSRLSPTRGMRAALRLGTEVKGFKLGLLSAFHQVHVGSHALWHWTNPFRAGAIDWESPSTRFAVEKGHLKLAPDPAELNIYAEGLLSPGLIHKIPIAGTWSKIYSQWMFSDYIPRLKLATFENALERNRQAYAKDLASGKLTEEELASRVGDSVNNAYGELNHLFLGKHGRDPRFQRLLRLIFLAPDFGEARLRFVEKAFTKYGHEERVALATMFTTLYVSSRIANWLSHGDPEWEWRRAFQVKTGKHWWTMRSVIGDVVHAIDRPGQFMYVRLSPLYSRTASDFLLGRDPRTGKKISGPQVVERLAEQVVPIQLGGLTRDDQKVWESFVTAMGVSAQRDTPVMDMKRMAAEWLQKKGLEPVSESIPTEAPSFAKLRMGIRIGNTGYASKILNELRKTRTDEQISQSMSAYVSRPFTGSNQHESEFVSHFTPDQKRMYLEARRSQMEDLREFYKLLARTPRK